MKRSTGRGGIVSGLTIMWAILVAACGGREVSSPVSTPQPPPIAEWQRPSRMGDVTPAVRLDHPASDSAGEHAGKTTVQRVPADGAGAGAAGTRVSLEPGMTLYSLARTYQVPLRTILQANGIEDPTSIPAGTEIYIPPAGGSRSPTSPGPPADQSSGTGRPPIESIPAPETDRGASSSLMSIAWPLDGRITGGFGQRTRHHHHDGIDIDGVRGEEVHAVAAGVVVRSGYDGKYGKTVVIDHGSGLTTLYAHASRLRVREGDEVEQGETIAEVGATGNARGTHLHFEVRRDGRPVDPIPYLKPETVGTSSR
jgi:murein DD-endopeptidase MepM/ murein hydrolase activator NlpD